MLAKYRLRQAKLLICSQRDMLAIAKKIYAIDIKNIIFSFLEHFLKGRFFSSYKLQISDDSLDQYTNRRVKKMSIGLTNHRR